MSTENGGVSCSKKKIKNKKNINIYPELNVGDKVEVRSDEKGCEGSWHTGTVIACEDQSYSVQYDHRRCIDSSNKLMKSIKVPHYIRPLPCPLYDDNNTLDYGQCVDAYRDNAWWEGVIFDKNNGSEKRLVFFPDMGHEMHFTRNNLRITQDLDEFSGRWKLRKNWVFLDLIEEFKQNCPLQVSVKQMWSEVKEKDGFRKQLKRWTSVGYDLWRNLVWEAFSNNSKLSLNHFFIELGDETYKSPLEFSEASFDDILKPKSHSSSSKTRGVNSGCVSKKREQMWLPANGDIVPGPESCPDSVQEFIRMYNCEESPSPELRQNLRKHLLFLGWKIEFMRIKGTLVFMYTSPEGKSYGTLLQVCENLKSEQSDQNIEAEIKESSCNGSKVSPKKADKKKEHNWEWGPADRRYVPKAESCPDAIQKYKLHMETRKRRAPKSLTLNVRKHLSFLGWKIEFVRFKGAPKLRYTSPEGISYVALSKALQNLSEGIDTSSTPKKILEKLVHGNLKGENSDLKSQPLQNLSKDTNALSLPNKNEGKIVGKNLNPTSKALQNLSEDNYTSSTPDQNKEKIICEDLIGKSPDPNSEPINKDFSCKGSEISLKKTNKRKKRIWGPADRQFLPEAEFCPDAIREFKLHLDTNKKPPKSNSLILNVRKHLSFLGWKIELTRSKGAPKLRYTSPEGKSFVTISKALEKLSEDTDNSSDLYQNKETVVPDLSKTTATLSVSCQRKAKIVSRLSETTGTLSVPCQNKAKIALEYYPEAIEQYYFLSSVTRAIYCKTFQDPKNNEVKTKAKKHLAAIGWKFTHYLRVSGKGETHYISRSGRKYDSLRSACKGCMDEGAIYGLNYVNGDEQTLARSLLNSKSNEVEGRTASQVRKRGRKRKSSVTALDSHLIRKRDKKVENKHLKKRKKRPSLIKSDLRKRPCLMKDRWDPEKSDDICSICHNGGELMLCDQCPSAFHTTCLGLQCVPVGEWFCPACCCGICGEGRFVKDTKEFGDESVLNCDQCEHKYHVGCLRVGGVLKLENGHKENWFCNERCEQIFLGLQKLLGKPVPVGDENITWTLLKYTESTDCDQNVQDDSDRKALAENYSKFNVALSVMHESFEPLREQKTRRDVLEDVIFSRSSELNRLNFKGFYTVLLEKNQEVITVATMRVHGEKVAELPLIGTKVKYRRLGMCHMLINELEKKLMELGVERLVLPAVPSLLNTWTESFRFSIMTELERLKFLNYIFLHFEGTTMCQKFLRDHPSPCLDQLEPEQTTLVMSENKGLDEKSVDPEIMQECPMSSIQETVVVSSIHESEPMLLTHEANSDDKVDITDQGSFET